MTTIYVSAQQNDVMSILLVLYWLQVDALDFWLCWDARLSLHSRRARNSWSPIKEWHRTSGVGTGVSGGSMNRGPELLGPPSSGASEKF